MAIQNVVMEQQLKPVFIGGAGRSGTTLLGAILGAHSRCLCTPESQFKFQLPHRLRMSKVSDEINLRDAMDILNRHHLFLLWGLGTASPIQFGSAERRLSVTELLTDLVRTYGRKQGREAADWWIDHTPTNLRHGKLLATWFPHAKFIHLVRDGRAVAASVMPLAWGPNTIVEAARYWKDQVSIGLAAQLYFGPDRAMQVRYEDLLENSSATVKRICDWLGVEYESGMEGRRGFATPIIPYATTQHVLVEQSIDATRASAWKSRLSSRQVELFENASGDLLDYLGYARLSGANPRRASKGESLRLFIQERSRRLINRRRQGRFKTNMVKSTSTGVCRSSG